MVFTPSKEQEPAINDRQKDILVSASAGSGKTAVLVERVIQLMETGRTCATGSAGAWSGRLTNT